MLGQAGVSVRLVKPVVAGLHSHGIDPGPLLAAAKVEPATLTDPDARLPHQVVLGLWQKTVEAAGDAAFGLHVAEGMDVSMLDVQGYALVSSANLREGFERVSHLHRLNHDASQVLLRPEERGAAWVHDLPGGLFLPRHPAEFVMATALVGARQASGRPVDPLVVRFAHARPDDISEHERFFRAPLRFDAGQNAIVFREDTLALPCEKADPVLLRVLERHGEDLLARMPKVDTLVDRVRALLTKALRGGNPSADCIADALHMSVRTLSRRLQAAGTSHKQLLDELRRDLCESYLGDRRLGVAEVAFLLGFGDASSFHRAFKRWYGTTPADYRRQAS